MLEGKFDLDMLLESADVDFDVDQSTSSETETVCESKS